MYKQQINFVMTKDIHVNYYKDQVEISLRILDICWQNIKKQDDCRLWRQIASVELRKLLCDKQPSIKAIAEKPEFIAFDLNYIPLEFDNETFYTLSPDSIIPKGQKKIPYEEWLTQKVFYFDRNYEDIPNLFDEYLFESIVHNIFDYEKRLKFKNFYNPVNLKVNDVDFVAYERKNPKDKEESREIYKVINKVGYNYIDVRRIIRLVGNKFGAHTSLNIPATDFLLSLESNIYNHFDIILFAALINLIHIRDSTQIDER